MIKIKKIKGFTVGLAVIIGSAMLMISVSITSILISDIKNSAVNTNSATAYNLAESVLSCAVSLDKNIRYYDGTNSSNIEDLGGIFPKNLKIFDQSPVQGNNPPVTPYRVPAYDLFANSFTPGYADKTYNIFDNNQESYTLSSVKCLGQSIMQGINTGPDPKTKVTAYNPAAAPLNLQQFAGGVNTSINFDKSTVEAYSGASGACAYLDVYAKDGNSQKLFVSRARLPCFGGNAVERVLVQYSN
jgi:hypothetical protein